MAYRELPIQHQYEDANGNPAVGYYMLFRIYNTTTPATVYTNSAGSASATGFVLNSAGCPELSSTKVDLYGDTAQTAGYKYRICRTNDWNDVYIDYPGPFFPPSNAGDISELANTSDNALGDALIGQKRTLSGAIAVTLHTYLEGVEVLYPFEFGLVGDDSDETTELTALFAAAAGKTIIFPVGKTYRSTTELVQPADTRVYMMGSTLKFVVTGAANCLLLRDRCEISGGTVELAGSAYSGHGFNGCPVVIGSYEAGTGYSDCKVDVIIKSNKSGGNGVGVTGDSSGFFIKARVTENNATLGSVAFAHWGGATTPSAGTYHPHDGEIRVICKDLSYNNANTVPAAVSGGYNITLKVDAGDVTYGRAAMAFVGDYGSQYASAEVQQKFMRNIRFSGSVKSSLVGTWTRCRNLLPTATLDYTADVVFDGFNIKGNANTSSGCVGFDGSAVPRGVTVINSTIDGFYENFKFVGPASNIRIAKNIIKNGYQYGINTGTTSSPQYDDFIIEDNDFIDNNTQGTANRGDISMNYAHRWHITKNRFDSPLNTWSIRGANTSTDPRMYDNHTLALVGAGPAISMGISTDYVINPMGSNNTAATGITPYGGCPLFTLNHLGNRQFYATAAPASGDWIVGDTWIDPTPVSGQPMGGANTVAGSPGTWTNMPNYA